jgi:hypothetical protein
MTMSAPRRRYKSKPRCSCQATLLDNGFCRFGCNTPKFEKPASRTRDVGVRESVAGARAESLTAAEKSRSSRALAAIDPIFAAAGRRKASPAS